MNGSITITKEDNTINLLMGINQRLMSEYDVINEKQENKNVKIKYHNYSNKRILIVDDNNLRLKEIKILLRPYNVEIVSVKNRRDMGNMLSANETFDMIIIDDIIPNFEIDSFAKEIIKDQNGNYISSVNGVELPNNIKKESKIKKLFKKLKL
jgi:CheY-like chemotaxis protein